MVSIKVDIDGFSLDQGEYKPDEKPTYGNIKKWVKEKIGIKERQNYNTGSGDGKVLTCPRDKEDAIMDAFRHFNLI